MGPVFHMSVGVVATILLRLSGLVETEFFGGLSVWAPYLIFWIWSSFLIDLDHVILFMIKGKGNPKRALELGLNDFHNMNPHSFLFHTLEFNLGLIVLAVFFPVARIVVLGTVYHLMFDIFAHYKYYRHFRWMRAWILIKNV